MMAQKFKTTIANILVLSLFVQTYTPLIAAKNLAIQKSGQQVIVTEHNQEILKKINEISNSDDSIIRIDNPHFESFVASIIKDALDKGIENTLPEGLLLCYEQSNLG